MAPPSLVFAALEQLPPGAAWGHLAWAAPAAGVGAAVLMRLYGLRLLAPLRRARRLKPDALHWTEEARLGWDARRRPILLTAIVAAAWAVAASTTTGPLGALGSGGAAALVGSAAFLGGGWAAARTAGEVVEAPGLGARLRGIAAMVQVRAASLLVVCAVLVAFPTDTVPGALGGVGVVALFLALWSRGAVVWTGRALKLWSEAPSEVVETVRAASERLERPAPRVFVLEAPVLNGFAVQGAEVVLLTRGLVEHLPPDELAAVVEHELEHLGEDASLRRVRRLPRLLLVAVPLLPLASSRLGGLAAVGLALGALAVAMVVLIYVRGRARLAEEAADDAGHHAHDAAYGRALERIYRRNRVPAVIGPGRAHPDLYDRLVACGVEPDWPRPRPPLRSSRLLGAAVVVAALLGAAAVEAGLRSVTRADRVALWPVLATAGAPHALMGHGRTLGALGRPEAGTTLMQLACHHQPRALDCAEAGLWLAELGHCEAAESALALAQEDLVLYPSEDGRSTDYVAEAATWVARCGSPAARDR